MGGHSKVRICRSKLLSDVFSGGHTVFLNKVICRNFLKQTAKVFIGVQSYFPGQGFLGTNGCVLLTQMDSVLIITCFVNVYLIIYNWCFKLLIVKIILFRTTGK